MLSSIRYEQRPLWVFGYLESSLDGQLAQRVVVAFETAAVDVHEDGVRDSDGAIIGVFRAHDRAELGPLADGRHDHVGVALEAEWDLLVELHGRVENRSGVDWRVKLSASAGRPFKKT